MPIKKSKGRRLQDASPFSSAIINIAVDSAILRVHQALVERASPKLLARFRPLSKDMWSTPSADPLTADLKTVSVDVGHVLVQWLYSATYRLREEQPETETASPLSPPPRSETLKIAFGVYSLSREYELSGLEALARDQISLLGSATDIFTFIDVIEEAYPRTFGKDNDAWLGEYITGRMKAALKDDNETNNLLTTRPERKEVIGEAEEGGHIPISKLLVKGMLEACRQVVQRPSELNVYAFPRSTNEKKKTPVSLEPPNSRERPQHEAALYDAVPFDTPVEVTPEVIPLAVQTRTTTEVLAVPAENRHASPDNDDWVFTSPQKDKKNIVEEEPVPVDLSTKKSKKYKKKKKGSTIFDLEPATEPEPAPTLETEPEPVFISEAANEDDSWGLSGVTSKKDKKKKKKKIEKPLDLEPEPVAEPIPEAASDPGPEPTAKIPEDQSVAAVMVEAGGEQRDVWEFWGAKRSPRQSLS